MKEVKDLIYKEFGKQPDKIHNLGQSGSDRIYYRFYIGKDSFIAVYNHQVRENVVFFEMSRHFRKKGINVPEIYAINNDKTVYLQQDLGDLKLFDHLINNRKDGFPAKETVEYYKASLEQLAEMQSVAAKDYNYDYTIPVKEFDKNSVLWDLNYFKYYYVLPSHAPFSEYDLENDFKRLAEDLMNVPSGFFMFRDFQSRNIMIHNQDVWFIDYQGGRKGAPQYDVASLLWQARADLPEVIKKELLEYYIEKLAESTRVDKDKFRYYYDGFVLIRVLQTLGAYGFRGLFEKKAHFLLSLPLAINNLKKLTENSFLLDNYPELNRLMLTLTSDKYSFFKKKGFVENNLNVLVTSFAYPNGLPLDTSGNGGGFIFDCRPVHNPGRYDEYKMLTGNDKPVIEFLDKSEEMQEYLSDVREIIDKAVKKYLKRKFTYLSVSFGCTGGQHRSVYAAERLAEYLRNNYSVNVVLRHREQNK